MRQLRAAIFILLAAPAAAVEDYDACVAMISADPAGAESSAADWARDGGGWPARHCRALALEATGALRAAAIAYSEIGEEAQDLPDEVRIEVFADAARLFLDIGAVEEAGLVTDAALQLSPRSRTARLANASLSAEIGDWRAALSDLDLAVTASGPDAELLVLRATAKRRLNDQVGARADAKWALELAPEDPAVWLELGETEAALGNRRAANAAWLTTIDLAGDTGLAEIARRKLQRLAAE
ncbi:MAG: hypothetical protein AAF568_07070 [Pseudomonadota bacterium]